MGVTEEPVAETSPWENRTKNLSIAVFFLVVMLILCVASSFFWRAKYEELRAETLKYGYAEWRNDNGEPVFHLITPTEKFVKENSR